MAERPDVTSEINQLAEKIVNRTFGKEAALRIVDIISKNQSKQQGIDPPHIGIQEKSS